MTRMKPTTEPTPAPAVEPTQTELLDRERDAIRAQLDEAVRAFELRANEIQDTAAELARIASRPVPDAEAYAALSARLDALRKLHTAHDDAIRRMRLGLDNLARTREALRVEVSTLRAERRTAANRVADYLKRAREAEDTIANMRAAAESAGGDVARIDAKLAAIGEP